ncbi:MAG: glyoxylate/hydroxypyruvate reductase A [Alphaproteobacteria bacterium]|nr:glyoxylate/hydroxypyruvate reductase A [Alphaproteobacteria bacterium]
MTILIASQNKKDVSAWHERLAEHLPGADVRHWTEDYDKAAVETVLMWKVPTDFLFDLPNLKLIQSLGAGVDHLVGAALPHHVPLARIVDPWMTGSMSEFILMNVLRFFRYDPAYRHLQAEGRWEDLGTPDRFETPIGILGMGELGQDAARKLRMMEFPVMGWSRSPKTVEGVESYTGRDGLGRMLRQASILICLLPLTQETRGLIDAEIIGLLPRGAYFINAARGGHVVDADLLAALDSGHLAGAALDVFEPEPLPADHPYWTHPKVILTPHIAADTNARTAARQIAENIRLVRAGQKPNNPVDTRRGY